MADAKRKYIDRMKQDMSPIGSKGFITEYLAAMRQANPEGADLLEADLVEILSSEKGLRVLKLLENSVLLRSIPVEASGRALRSHNAVRQFVLEIRRIVAHAT